MRALEGETGAFNRLVAEHWAPLAEYAGRLLREGGDAGDDVAQEVFLRLWAGTLKAPGDPPPRAFLLRVARNLCLNRLRKRSVHIRLAGRLRAQLSRWQRTPTPSEDSEEAELRRRLEAELERMPDRRREVFLLIRGQGLSYADAARVMGVSPQTVANQMSAALSTLRRSL